MSLDVKLPPGENHWVNGMLADRRGAEALRMLQCCLALVSIDREKQKQQKKKTLIILSHCAFRVFYFEALLWPLLTPVRIISKPVFKTCICLTQKSTIMTTSKIFFN